MKILDENGMIFGKINIIDVTVLLFLLILLFTGYKYLYLKNYPQNVLDKIYISNDTWINVTISYKQMDVFLFEKAVIGDEEHRKIPLETNVTIARLINKTQWSLINETNHTVDAVLVFELYVYKRLDGYYYKSNRIIMEKDFNFDAYTYILSNGRIVNIEEDTT